MNGADEFPPALRPPQFSLRTLLLLVSACAVVFALANVLPPMILAGLVFLVLTIVVHVAGNAIGTRLRDLGGRPAQHRLVGPAEGQAVGQNGPPRCAPPTELSRRQSLGWPVLVVAALGTLAGATGGALWATHLAGNRLTFIAVIIGALACGVLGGFASFLAFSFAQVGLGAWRQSMSSGSGSTEDVPR